MSTACRPTPWKLEAQEAPLKLEDLSRKVNLSSVHQLTGHKLYKFRQIEGQPHYEVFSLDFWLARFSNSFPHGQVHHGTYATKTLARDLEYLKI